MMMVETTPPVMMEVEEGEEVSSEELSMNQLDTSKEKLMAKNGCGLFFGDDGDTSSTESEPRSPIMPSSRMRSNPDGNDDDFWM
jgi:hypothetical protein